MGLSYSGPRGIDAYVHPDDWPDPHWGTTYDPQFGFPEGRRPRQMQTSWEELDKYGVANADRDYCAHHLIRFYKCKLNHFPFVRYYCGHIRHEYEFCEFSDYVLRMKEYERERRLILRAKRIGGAENSGTDTTTVEED